MFKHPLAGALVTPVIALALACPLRAGAEHRTPSRETVAAAVLVDHQAPAVTWTTLEVATAEFDGMERALGVQRPPFAYHEQFVIGHQGWVAYRTIDGQLVLDMYLRPVYQSQDAARYVAAHELGHTYAIWYQGDTSEAAADSIAACFGSDAARRLAPASPADCEDMAAPYRAHQAGAH